MVQGADFKHLNKRSYEMKRMTLIVLLGLSLLMSLSAEAGNKHRHHGKKHYKNHHHHHYYAHGDRRHNCRYERRYRDARYSRRYDGHYRELGIEYGYRYVGPGETVVVFQSPNFQLGYRN